MEPSCCAPASSTSGPRWPTSRPYPRSSSAMAARSRRRRRDRRGRLMGERSPWLRAIDRTVPLRGDAELLPGLRAIALPGHTDGFQGVVADTATGRPIVIAGDAVPYLANLYPPEGGPPTISGIHMSGVREYYRSLERIKALDPLQVMPGN